MKIRQNVYYADYGNDSSSTSESEDTARPKIYSKLEPMSVVSQVKYASNDTDFPSCFSVVSDLISKPLETDQILCDNIDPYLGDMDISMCPDEIEAELIATSVAVFEEHQIVPN